MDSKEQDHPGEITTVAQLMRALDADMRRDFARQRFFSPYTPPKLSWRRRVRSHWVEASKRYRRSLAKRIYDFEDEGW